MLTKEAAEAHVAKVITDSFESAKQRGISYADLARALGIGDKRSTLLRWGNVETMPRAAMFLVLQDWLAANPVKRTRK